MKRSAKDKLRSNLHYGSEGSSMHPSYQGIWPRRARVVPVRRWKKQTYTRERSGEGCLVSNWATERNNSLRGDLLIRTCEREIQQWIKNSTDKSIEIKT